MWIIEHIAIANGAINDDFGEFAEYLVPSLQILCRRTKAGSVIVCRLAESNSWASHTADRKHCSAIDRKEARHSNVFVAFNGRVPRVEREIVNWRLSHVLGAQLDRGYRVVHSPLQFSIHEDVSPQRAVFLVPRDPGLPAGEARRASSRYERGGENIGVRLVIGITAVLAAFGLVWRSVWHGTVLVRDSRPFYNNVVAIVLLLLGMAALWTGIWLLFPLTANYAMAEPLSGAHCLRWEGGEV